MELSNDEKKRWVLVTGGTRGIGKGLVSALAQAGYKVVFTYKNSENLAREIEKNDLNIQGYRCDISSEKEVRNFAETILSKMNCSPYAVINNAGITRDNLLLSMASENWKSVIDTNLNAAFYVNNAFVSAMVEEGDGVVLHISSVAGIKGSPGQTNYSATKAALIGLTKTMSLELARFNIRVNAIAPGFIDTELVNEMPEKEKKSIKKMVPLRRIGEVNDVAALALFLLSSNATYITGQNFVVDGGLTA